MKVLGAAVHGDYTVLEFQSFESLPPSYRKEHLRPNDVLIRVSYTDVNPVDLQKLRGRNDGATVAEPPHVPGYGGSGVVLEVGSQVPAPEEWIGRAVCFLGDPSRKTGSYATHVVADARCVARLPTDAHRRCVGGAPEPAVALRDAACIPVAGLTAYESLVKCGLGAATNTRNTAGTDAGDGPPPKSLLIVGASGGVGSWILTLARAMHPSLNIIATASTEEQQSWCQSLGANQVMQHDGIGKCLPGGIDGSVDAIVCLTEPTPTLFSALSEVVRPHGRICLVVAGRSIECLNLGFCFFKCVDITTETVFSSIRSNFTTIMPAAELQLILSLMAEGTVVAPLSPDLKDGRISEAFDDATKDNGVLKALDQPTGRRGNFVMNVAG